MIIDPKQIKQFFIPENCFIKELYNSDNDPSLSIALAHVKPKVTTKLHQLTVDEKYIILRGSGKVVIKDQEFKVSVGDVVVIPKNTPQKIKNTGGIDLIFYCICTPRFTNDGYQILEEN